MTWIIPSQAWKDEVMVLRELFNLTFPQAKDVLDYFGTAEAAFEALA